MVQGMGEQGFKIFLAGDAMITLPWSHVDAPEFCALVARMRAADVTIINLETVIHSFKGYAQANSGGTWTASPPIIAGELAWAGVDMVSHANNHAFDYGSEGLMETHQHVTKAGIVISGSGKDLQHARSHGSLVRGGWRVAHLSLAATFVPYGRASRSRSDLRGRPGVNPLTVIDKTIITIPERFKSWMQRIDKLLRNDQTKYEKSRFIRFGKQFVVGDSFYIERGKRLDHKERSENLKAIAEASNHSDITVVSLHSHDESKWLRNFVLHAIATGADIVHVHGCHDLRGIELLNGRPVFYGLGDFVFQTAQVAPLPSEAYEAVGLDESASPADLREASKPWDLNCKPWVFRGCAAELLYEGNQLRRIELCPLDLQFGAAMADLGRPQIADKQLGRQIIEQVSSASARFGTEIHYDSKRNIGVIEVSQWQGHS
jgi:poly-gamma-glutamate synthesis protein (capsule biosynthesis protein)